MIIKLLVDAGNMKIVPAVAQKLGPLGINMGKLTGDVNKATSNFAGMKVPVLLDINAKTKEYNISVKTPPTAELLKRELGVEKGTPGRIKVGNAAIEQAIKIAKMKQEEMNVSSLKEALKNVLGTCACLGLLVESKEPKEIIQNIDAYQESIEKGITQASDEKLAKLAKDFEAVKKEQERIAKEKEAAEKAKEEAAKAAAPAEETAAPAEEEAKEKTEKKPEEKKK